MTLEEEAEPQFRALFDRVGFSIILRLLLKELRSRGWHTMMPKEHLRLMKVQAAYQKWLSDCGLG